MKKLVKELTETFGPAGEEGKIRELIKTKVETAADDIKVDSMGNLIVYKQGQDSSKTVMLAAHMDEIGLIATHIDEDGFIRFSRIGGLPTYNLLGTRVIFNGKTVGVVDKEDKLDEISKLKPKKMYIDIGAKDKEAAQKKVEIGDTASYLRNLELAGDRIMAKALDDRAGCAVLIEALKKLETPTYDTCFVFTVQEEVGLRGAKVSAYGIEPDIGLAVDLTMTGDRPESDRMAVSLGEGPTIKVKDKSLLVDPQLKEALISTAEKNDLPYQLEVLTKGGTDAGSIQLTREGVIAGAVSIPGRYVHSESEMIDLNDLNQATKLVTNFLASDYKPIF